ncbi:hypothetical protein MPTK1_8g15310 [Marchantia polymorpha subsp. ruderalis]|uniref:Uncharacterized protein n=1 Tax=Marchantia polymorpha TaxID=3197 RepID=A0A2R6W1F9_MARPO|nr:hypothetical protein MARPO_0187s0018 [Marchantia polymorpha]BBN19968.1 hypothetical protein Mp_8g15310 [Marchantia polymorpha subsp. ruderalis]|eukprot:PTQ27697.1 hypothetical protein MARPO_0187s0018 [Marchantia polymorpha]
MMFLTAPTSPFSSKEWGYGVPQQKLMVAMLVQIGNACCRQGVILLLLKSFFTIEAPCDGLLTYVDRSIQSVRSIFVGSWTLSSFGLKFTLHCLQFMFTCSSLHVVNPEVL